MNPLQLTTWYVASVTEEQTIQFCFILINLNLNSSSIVASKTYH